MKVLKTAILLSITAFLIGNVYAYEFGDAKSVTLTGKAWQALEAQDFDAVEAYTEKCISLYSKHALKQQAELNDFAEKEKAANYWALNDVATCYFIKAKALNKQGKHVLAKKVAQMVVDEFGYAQCFDPQGWFWSVGDACRDLMMTAGKNLDFGDYTSTTITTKAWEALGTESWDDVLIYTNKCIALYEKEATKQQASLTNYAPKDRAFDNWALNDVATCYFIQGEAFTGQKEWKKAIESYKRCIDDFVYGQCWDPKGWFWKPAAASRGKVNKIMAEQGML